MRNAPATETAYDAAFRLPTPLLRLGQGAAKLESLRPSGGADDRALPLWDALGLPRGAMAAAVVQAGGALAAAAWARARGLRLQLFVHGPVTHEVRKGLELWALPFAIVPSEQAAHERAQRAGAQLLPPLDGEAAVRVVSGALGAELLADLEQAQLQPAALIAPGGARAALDGALRALRQRWPSLRAIALAASSAEDVLPELPLVGDLRVDGAEARRLSRVEAAAARAWLSRSAGLLASHASAAAAQLAAQLGGVALITSTGEREFSLDPEETP